MNSIPDVEVIDSPLDDMPEETYPDSDSIGLTFAGGIHERDLLSFFERAQRLAGEVC
jgi:hypothetical protein